MDFSSINQYANNLSSSAYSAQTDKLASMANGLNKDSSYEEMEGAAKKFEAYLLEQTIKEVKKSIDELKGEESDDYASQTTSVFMDQTIQSIAETMVDQYGQRLTKELTDQMARNKGIEIPDEKKLAEGEGTSGTASLAAAENPKAAAGSAWDKDSKTLSGTQTAPE